MISQGVIFKRCGCRDLASGRQLGRSCPQLAKDRHGSWYFHVSVTNLMGRRERVRRGGYPTQAAARHARDEALAGRGRIKPTKCGLSSGGCGTGCPPGSESGQQRGCRTRNTSNGSSSHSKHCYALTSGRGGVNHSFNSSARFCQASLTGRPRCFLPLGGERRVSEAQGQQRPAPLAGSPGSSRARGPER
jgi:hypothetical protein